MKYLKFIGKFGGLKHRGFKYNLYAGQYRTWELHTEREHYPLSIWKSKGEVHLRHIRETLVFIFEKYISLGLKVPSSTTLDNDARIYFKRNDSNENTSHTVDRTEFRLDWMDKNSPNSWFYDDVPGDFINELISLHNLGWLTIGDTDDW